ncbi:MAG: MATE family efflux transporter [Lachnospiraceae bacterium]|nr:MATE family efflux transporter [Lachnospiraceae bacterium]
MAGNGKARMDLTRGPVFRTLFVFSLPILAGSVVTQLYNVADSIVVGQVVGADALAAVSAATPAMSLINMFLIGLSTGSNVVIAHRAGSQDNARLQKAVGTVAALTLAISLFVTVAGSLLSRPLLRAMQTPENVLSDAVLYLTVIFIGTSGNLIYNMGSGALRGMGDSLWPFLFLTFCSVLNVILDVLFVAVFGMGVLGAAVATAIAQLISGIGIVLRLNRGNYGVKLRLSDIRFDPLEAKSVISIGLPASIQNVGNAIANICCQTFYNGFGSTFIAGNSIVTKIEDFSYIPAVALSTAVCTFVGQNIAAMKMDRLKKGVNSAMLVLFGIGTAMCGVMLGLRDVLPLAFTKDADVILIASEGLSVLAFVSVFHGIDRVLVNAMRGAGKSVVPMVTAQFGAFSRIPLVWLLAVRTGNYHGVFYAMLIASLLRTLAIMAYYFFGGWKNTVRQYLEKHEGPSS